MSNSSRLRVAAFLGLFSQLLLGGVQVALAINPEDTPMTCIAMNHDFTLKDLHGRFVVVHFLTQADAAAQESYVRSYVAGIKSLAGVHNVFVRSDDLGAIKTLAGKVTARGAEFAYDADGKLAKEFRLASAAGPSLITLDEQGRELFRHSGSGPTDLLAFAAFKPRLESAWMTPARSEYNLPKDSTLAVQGYDVVAYFADNKPTKGDERYTAEYRGVIYRFAGEDHRDLFVADPHKYLPTYGGWCASAMGNDGSKVSIDPTNFKIKDGRLFLFYKSLFANALTDWNKHEKEWEPAADSNWKKRTGE